MAIEGGGSPANSTPIDQHDSDPNKSKLGGENPQKTSITGGILPQSMPTDKFDSPSVGQPGHVSMSMPQRGFESGTHIYHNSPSFHQSSSLGGKPFTSSDSAPEGTLTEPPSTPSVHSTSSPSYAPGASGAAFGTLQPIDSSTRLPIMPPYPSPASFSPSPVYGYGSSSPGFSNTIGGNFQDMSSLPPPPHLFAPSMGSISPQLQASPYDMSATSSPALNQMLSNASVGPGGSQSAYAAARLSGDSFGMGGSMYSALQPHFPYGHSFPDQYQRTSRGNYGVMRGRGNYRGGPAGSGMPYPNSPGPPILNPGNSKGPDGANLFIFHIPNDFSNQDMHALFSEHGNVLSVRIMVEPDTGRSRGFGFVSYDSAESAALAIKHLNGFAIKGKRLKVQHKQIRKSEGYNGNTGDQNQKFYPPRHNHSSRHELSRRHQEHVEGPFRNDSLEGGTDEGAGARLRAQENSSHAGHNLNEATVAQGSAAMVPTSELQNGPVSSHDSQHDITNDASISPLTDLGALGNALPNDD